MNASGGAASGSNRVCRGGGWDSEADSSCTVSRRGSYIPNGRDGNLGFRLVRSAN